MEPTLEQKPPGILTRLLTTSFGTIIMVLALLWAIESVDAFVLDDRLQSNGIQPRTADGVDGVLWAPFLHGGFDHLISNTVPFAVLGWLVSLRGRRRWWMVTIVATIVGGGLTWLLAGSGNHIGASGVVFGYFGALVGAAFYERRPATIAPALVAIFFYGTILIGLVPQAQVSWEGHLFGLIGGLLAARWMAEPRPRSSEEADSELNLGY